MGTDVGAWVPYSDEDLKSAEALLAAGRFVRVPLFCQQAIEKRLKAVLLQRTGEEPPRIHHLLHLAGLAGLTLTEDAEGLLFDLTQLYITSRYPGFQLPADMAEDRAQTETLLVRTREVSAWLDQSLKPKDSRELP